MFTVKHLRNVSDLNVLALFGSISAGMALGVCLIAEKFGASIRANAMASVYAFMIVLGTLFNGFCKARREEASGSPASVDHIVMGAAFIGFVLMFWAWYDGRLESSSWPAALGFPFLMAWASEGAAIALAGIFVKEPVALRLRNVCGRYRRR